MSYKLNNVDIASFGAIAAIGSQKIAVEGVFDLPKRIGATERNWGSSIEPFVDAADIELDGREFVLNLIILKTSNQLTALKQAIVGCTTFSTDYDNFSVVCKDGIEITELGNYLSMVCKFWQSSFVLKSLTLSPPNTGAYRLDTYNLQNDFGITINSIKGLNSIAGRIEVGTTEPYGKTQYRDLRELTIECHMKGSSLSDLYAKMCQFHSLCYKPGFRTFVSAGNANQSIYFKSGFKAQYVAENVLKFTLKAIIND